MDVINKYPAVPNRLVSETKTVKVYVPPQNSPCVAFIPHTAFYVGMSSGGKGLLRLTTLLTSHLPQRIVVTSYADIS